MALGTLTKWVGILATGSSFGCTQGRPDHPTEAALIQSLEGASISDEFDLTNPHFEAASARSLSIASGPPGYLAVSMLYGDPTRASETAFIMATRIAPDGTVLDPHGRYLGAGRSARGIYAGDHWVVLRRDALELVCTELSDDGSEVESGGTSLGELPWPTSVAYDGSAMLMSGYDGRAFLLAPDCTLLSAPVVVGPSSAKYSWSRLAFDGVSYLVTYTTNVVGQPDRLFLQKISTAGELVGSPLVLATATWTRDTLDTEGYEGVQGLLASEGGKNLLAYWYSTWNPVTSTAPADITHYRLVDSDGSLGADHTLASAGPTSVRTAGNGFILGSFPSALVKLDLDGNEQARLTDFGWMPLTDGFVLPSVANRGTDLLLHTDGLMRRYDGAFSPTSDPAPFLLRAADSARHKVATAGDVRLVVSSDASGTVYGSLLSKAGSILSSEPFVVIPFDDKEPEAALGANGTNFLVATHKWGIPGSGKLEARIISSLGAVEAPTVVMEQEDTGQLSVTSDGSNYLVGFAQGNPDGSRLLAKRLSSSGALLDTDPIVVLAASWRPLGPLLCAYDGADYVVAFADEYEQINVGWISPDGKSVAVTKTPWSGWLKSLGGGAGKALLTYYVTGASQTQYAALIPRRGQPIDFTPFAVSTTPSSHGSSVAWDGHNFWISWQDLRRGHLRDNVYGEDIYASRVSPAGSMLDPDGILLSLGEFDVAGGPGAVLSAEPGKVFAAYARWDASYDYRALRLHGRTLSSSGDSTGVGGSGGADAGAAGEGGSAAGGTGSHDGSGGSQGGTAGKSHGAAGAGQTTDGSGGTGGSSRSGTSGGGGEPAEDGGAGGTTAPSGGRTSGPSSAGGGAGLGVAGKDPSARRVAPHTDSDGGCVIAATRGEHPPVALAFGFFGLALLSRRRQQRREWRSEPPKNFPPSRLPVQITRTAPYPPRPAESLQVGPP